jgi:hypothetical protein
MIERKLLRLVIEWPVDNPSDVTIESVARITDDEEGTSVGNVKRWRGPQAVAAAIALRTEILDKSAAQERPFVL